MDLGKHLRCVCVISCLYCAFKVMLAVMVTEHQGCAWNYMRCSVFAVTVTMRTLNLTNHHTRSVYHRSELACKLVRSAAMNERFFWQMELFDQFI